MSDTPKTYNVGSGLDGVHNPDEPPNDITTMRSIPFVPIPAGTATCSVAPIVNATLTIPEAFVVSPASSATAKYNVPTFVFLITHNQTGKRLLFDLGVRYDWETAYPEEMIAITKDPWDPKIVADVGEILKDGGVEPGSIDGIIFSHHHWDHTGLISPFTKAELIGGLPTFQEGASGNGKDVRGRAVDLAKQVAESGRKPYAIDFDKVPSVPVGSFERAIDYFGDGSVFICSTAGHTAGHVSALVRTTPSPNASYVLLGGDTAHHPALLCPCPKHNLHINTTFRRPGEAAPRVMYVDVPLAWDTMERTARLEKEENVMVVVAHDYMHWRAWRDDKTVMFPGEGIGKWMTKKLKVERTYDPSTYDEK